MNISAPPTTSRGHGTPGTRSLTRSATKNVTNEMSKLTRPNSAVMMTEMYHNANGGTVRNFKNSATHRGSTPSLLRYSSNESNGAKQHGKSESVTERTIFTPTQKVKSPRSQSLTVESSKKLDEFINNVKNSQFNQHSASVSHAPSPQPHTPQQTLKHPVSQRPSLSSTPLNRSTRSINFMIPDPNNASEKKRLVKQFYEDGRAAVKWNHLTSKNGITDSTSPSPEPIPQHLFNTFQILSDDEQSGLEDQEAMDPKAEVELDASTIEKQILKLKLEVVNEVKSKINQAEHNTMTLLNAIETQTNKLVELNEAVHAKYDESKPAIAQLHERDFSKYTTSNKNKEFDESLNELDSNLQKYRGVINGEKTLMNEIDEDLAYLEKLAKEKFNRAKFNRNRAVVIFLSIAFLYIAIHFC